MSRLPYATTLNYWGQKYITRSQIDPASNTRDRLDKARWFVAEYVARTLGDPQEATFFEFGAGWDLAGPLALYCLGIERQILVDLARVANLDLANGVIRELNRLGGELPRTPGEPLKSIAELEQRFGIVYRAPADARATELPSDSIDCITSTPHHSNISPPATSAKYLSNAGGS